MFVSLLLFFLVACAPSPVRPPNLLVVDIDSLRADRLWAVDAKGPVMPHAAALAREGVSFSHLLTSSAWTLPAVVTLLSGRYPQVIEQQGKTALWRGYGPDVHTVEEVLSLYAYRTAVFPGQTFITSVPGLLGDFQVVRPADDAGSSVPAVLSWVEEEPRRPFFVLVHEYDTHNTGFATGAVAPNLGCAGPTLPEHHECLRRRLPAGEALSATVSAYDDAVREADARLGALVDGLAARGLLDETVVVVTSNHGEELWEHGLIGHWKAHYDTVLQVPLVVRDPALPAPRRGTRVEEVVQLMDLAPTLLARAGVPPDMGMDGQSLLPLLGLAEGVYTPRDAFGLTSLHTASLRTAHHKLIVSTPRPEDPQGGQRAGATHLLFDLEADPGETTDLYPSQPAFAEELEERLLSWVQARADQAEGRVAQPLSGPLVETLRARGYWER